MRSRRSTRDCPPWSAFRPKRCGVHYPATHRTLSVQGRQAGMKLAGRNLGLRGRRARSFEEPWRGHETGSVGDTWYLVQSKYGSAASCAWSWCGPQPRGQDHPCRLDFRARETVHGIWPAIQDELAELAAGRVPAVSACSGKEATILATGLGRHVAATPRTRGAGGHSTGAASGISYGPTRSAATKLTRRAMPRSMVAARGSMWLMRQLRLPAMPISPLTINPAECRV
jgi:hypothetical protein